MGSWLRDDGTGTKDFELTEDLVHLEGFVYLITNLDTGKQYIGKKSFWSRRKSKGVKNRQTKESDWKEYYSSSDDLKRDVQILGPDHFRREILFLCTHKKVMSYLETKEQFDRNVLLDGNYYNMCIAGKYYVKDGRIIELSLAGARSPKGNMKRRRLMKERNLLNNPMKNPETIEKLRTSRRSLKHTSQSKELMAAPRRKQWIITTPEGTKLTSDNLVRFCKDYDLIYSSLYDTLQGRQKTFQGYQLERNNV